MREWQEENLEKVIFNCTLKQLEMMGDDVCTLDWATLYPRQTESVKAA